jgi:hypothetical protein
MFIGTGAKNIDVNGHYGRELCPGSWWPSQLYARGRRASSTTSRVITYNHNVRLRLSFGWRLPLRRGDSNALENVLNGHHLSAPSLLLKFT